MTKPETTPQAPLSGLSPERYGPNTILGLRTGLATADVGGYKLEFDTTIGLGGSSLTVHVKGLHGERISESLDLRPLLDEWGARLVAELKAGGSDAKT